MNADLSRQLDEMGSEYRDLVIRMRGAFEPATRSHRAVWLVAASLLAAMALSILFMPLGSQSKNQTINKSNNLFTIRVTDPHNEYVLATLRNDEAVREMIRTQRSDGSWKNNFLTRRNAEALKSSRLPEAQIAYKRAKRALRLTGAEL